MTPMAFTVKGLTTDGKLPASAKTDLSADIANTSSTVRQALNAAGLGQGAKDSDIAGYVADRTTATGAAVASTVRAATATAVAMPGRKWAFLGDSITNGSSASNFAFSYPTLSVEVAGSLLASSSFIESGVPGQTITQMAARVEQTLAAGAEGLVVLAGANDANQSAGATTLASFQASYKTIVDAAKLRGIPVVVCTVLPRAETPPAHTRAAIESYNAWLRLWAPAAGCYVAETWGAVVDPATGDLPADMFAAGDSIHPNDKGHLRIAQAVGKAIREASRSRLDANFVFAKTTSSLSPNPLMNSTTGVRPSSFFEQPGGTGTAPVYTMVANTGTFLPAGQWAQMDFDGTTEGGIRSLATSLSSTGWAAGDRLVVTGFVEVEDVTGNWVDAVSTGTASATPMVVNGSTGVAIQQAWSRNPGRKRAGTNVYELGPFFTAFTVPANVTALTLWFRVRVPTGGRIRARIGATDVLNLTRLGVAGVEPGYVQVPA